MSGQLAAAEPYTTRFETEVTAVDGREVWLETSYFYAESGGQPADRGTIGDVPVESVRLVDGDLVHVLAEEPRFGAGHRALCAIDWSFRMYCMRAHTASHALYGAGRRQFPDLEYAGFDIGERTVRVDLETPAEIDDEALIELNEAVNRVVWESRPVTWESVPAAEAREREEVAFNDATEDAAFSKGRVRIVTIGDADGNGRGESSDPWDVAACGGTHVRNTREIGPVTLLGRSNPGAGVTRIELAVGPRAIDRRTTEKRTAFAAKSALGTAVDDVPAEIDRLEEERDSLEERLRRRERELLGERLENGSTIERDDRRWLVAAVGDLPTDAAADVVRERVADGVTASDSDAVDSTRNAAASDGGDAAAVVVAVGERDSPFAVVGTDGSVDATDVLDDLVAAFGGGGGGSSELAQGGGFDATVEEIVTRFE